MNAAERMEITRSAIETAIKSKTKLRPAAERWHRSRKDWVDKQLLTESVIGWFGVGDLLDTEDRILIGQVAREAAAKVT